jgi:hypothetical protein
MDAQASAVSAVIARLPLRILVRRLRDAPMARATATALNASGSRNSARRTCPD